jgi:hypothetical protein
MPGDWFILDDRALRLTLKNISMARQKGFIRLKGTLGDVSFYEHKEYGPVLRMKGGPTRNQLKHGRKYDITRRHNSEFGRASHYGALLRRAFRLLVRYCKETRLDTRLSSRLREIIWMDKESEFGKRDLRRDTINAFHHFELDSKNLAGQYFELPVETTATDSGVDIVAGVRFAKMKKGVAAWRIRSVAVSIDLLTEKAQVNEQDSDLYELEKGSFAEAFHHELTHDGQLFHGIGILFYAYDPAIDDYVVIEQDHVHAGFIRYLGECGSGGEREV